MHTAINTALAGNEGEIEWNGKKIDTIGELDDGSDAVDSLFNQAFGDEFEHGMRLSPRLDNFLLKDWCKAPWFTICHCLPIASSEIDFIRRPILESRMNPPGVVKIHIMLNTETELRQADILFDFDVLIFQRPPETFHFCIIQTSSPSVHADLNAMVPKFRYKLRAGKLASLIRIENLRFPVGIHRRF